MYHSLKFITFFQFFIMFHFFVDDDKKFINISEIYGKITKFTNFKKVCAHKNIKYPKKNTNVFP